MLFEHESGLLFLALLLVLKAYDLIKDAQNRKTHTLIFSLFLVSLVWGSFHLFQVPPVSRKNFIEQLAVPNWKIFRYCSVFFILLFALNYLKIEALNLKLKNIFLSVSAFVVFLFFADFYRLSRGGELIWDVYRARTTALFLVTALGALYFLSVKSERFSVLDSKVSLIIIAFALMTSVLHDLLLTSNWSRATTYLSGKINSVPSCLQIPAEEAQKGLIENAFEIRSVPYYSLIQARVKYGSVGTLLFAQQNLNYKLFQGVQNSCCFLITDRIPFGDVLLKIEPDWSFDLSPIKNELIKTGVCRSD